MSIQAPLLGRYEDIIAFIAGIEDLNRAIVINNLQISQDTNGIISGNIVLEFYSVYKPIKSFRRRILELELCFSSRCI